MGINIDTPIYHFVRDYAEGGTARFHMPGHKGQAFLGCEPYDITEIAGASVLHHGDGIIQESEKNAALLFGSGATHYSAEGSTLCIKAMLAILKMGQGACSHPPLLAARNVHRSMVDACALLGLDIVFIQPSGQLSLCSCAVSGEDLEQALLCCKTKPLGVYITSPDYLGQITDIAALSTVCQKWQLPLLVDNAHGAYLHFLGEGVHPLDLGADMCCDSAHKTLPALTGAAYLHIHRNALKRFGSYAAQAMRLFSSTSPSYLILQSLDLCNAYLAGEYRAHLAETANRIAEAKEKLVQAGICLQPSEPLKIVLHTARQGFCGEEIADEMRDFGIECEYADWQAVVLMATPQNSGRDWERLWHWAKHTKLTREKRKPLPEKALFARMPERAMTIRDAVFAPSEVVPVQNAVGRICAAETVSCPPAVPIAVSGERITEEMEHAFLQYGIQEIRVVCPSHVDFDG